jgi:hypothetical protein
VKATSLARLGNGAVGVFIGIGFTWAAILLGFMAANLAALAVAELVGDINFSDGRLDDWRVWGRETESI